MVSSVNSLPRGTPDFTLAVSDWWLSTTTRCMCPERNDTYTSVCLSSGAIVAQLV